MSPLPFRCSALLVLLLLLGTSCPLSADEIATQDEWHALFDGHSLAGWRASENPHTWRVEDGCLVADGPRSHLFYQGPIGDHDFRNFELRVEVRAEAGANSGIYFHTQYQPQGFPDTGYEVQVNNSDAGAGSYRELKRTGSLYAVRNIYPAWVDDGRWSRVRIRVIANHIRVWVNEQPTVDYVQPADPPRRETMTGRLLSHGTIALQGHDPESRAQYRSVRLRTLPDDAPPELDERASDRGYGLDALSMDALAAVDFPLIDFHVHLRGGMTVEKAVQRQAVTGMNCGVLRNLGTGWPIETDDQLRSFLDSVADRPVFVGLQVNDRDWMTRHAPELLRRLDYVLADTMIMPMPDDDSPPVKLWIADQYTIEDPEAWMERYLRHNLRVLSEPISILANPTYLPPAVEHLHEELWTEDRMRQVIAAAVSNGVALEINARSGLPPARFIRLARQMGARFTFGSNNFDDRPIDMSRCLRAHQRYGLTKDDMYVPDSAPVSWDR